MLLVLVVECLESNFMFGLVSNLFDCIRPHESTVIDFVDSSIAWLTGVYYI